MPAVERSLVTAHVPRAIESPGPLTSTTRPLDRGTHIARATLFSLLEAVVRGDAHTLRRLLVEEPLAVHSLRTSQRIPLALGARRREEVVRSLLMAQRAARSIEGVALGDLVDPSRVVVETARDAFDDATLAGLEPQDLVIRFEVDELASRTFLALANQGRGLVVVSIAAEGARIVGL
jgi:hypothetical protein